MQNEVGVVTAEAAPHFAVGAEGGGRPGSVSRRIRPYFWMGGGLAAGWVDGD